MSSKAIKRGCTKRYHRVQRHGIGLVDVVVGCVFAAGLLVPSMSLLCDAARWSARVECKNEMVLLAEAILQTVEFEMSQEFRAGQRTGDCSEYDHPEVCFVVNSHSHEFGDSSLWMPISVTVWRDLNRNRSRDDNEPQHTLDSAMARRS